MDNQFMPINEHRRLNDIKINTMQINQEATNAKLFARLEATTNNVNAIANADNGPSINKLIKTGRFITRTSVAKNLLNATKITANSTNKDAKSPTSVVNRDSSLSPEPLQQEVNMEYNSDYEDDEIIEFEESMVSEIANLHGAEATVNMEHK
jgi:hypothetical protein